MYFAVNDDIDHGSAGLAHTSEGRVAVINTSVRRSTTTGTYFVDADKEAAIKGRHPIDLAVSGTSHNITEGIKYN